MVDALLTVWAAWAVFNLLLLLFGHRLAPPPGPYTNGLQIIVPPACAALLAPDELAAVIAHERGHRAKLHAFKNLLRAVVFIPRSRETIQAQELEADDYAARHADPAALAAALRKMSGAHFDLYRATRLELLRTSSTAGTL